MSGAAAAKQGHVQPWLDQWIMSIIIHGRIGFSGLAQVQH